MPNNTRRSISAREPDWSREKPRGFWDPGRKLLKSIRDYQTAQNRSGLFANINRKAAVLRHGFWSAVAGADIPLNTTIGGGLLLPHPNGIVIHPDVVIGPNCLIMQQVTLGSGPGGVPVLGGHVDISAGAKVIGGARLADHSLIGANAVVLDDVPEAATAVGVPARIVNRDKHPSPPEETNRG